jgi:hypothetical protein
MPQEGVLTEETAAFYRAAMRALESGQVPYLVGGAYAFSRYTGIERHTKDFDIFVHRRDFDRALAALDAGGWRGEMTFPHWLGKAWHGDDFVDLIFGSGNGVAMVDDLWFEHSVESEVLGHRTRLIPAEEMIWSKAFIMERERFDGADVAHVLKARAESLDWPRLLRRFDQRWRVLLAHLVLFGFIFPGEQHRIPRDVMDGLLLRLQFDVAAPPADDRLCQGTLVSRAQYLVDVRSGYRDARLADDVSMTAADIAHWTAAIAGEPNVGIAVELTHDATAAE